MTKTTKPVFKFKQEDIESCFKLALKNIVKYGDTDIFPFPYETRMFDDMEVEMLASLKDTYDNFDKKEISPHR